MTKKKRFLIDS